MTYQTLKKQYSSEHKQLNKRYNLISTLRIIAALTLAFFIYKFIDTNKIVFVLLSLLLLICFVVLMRIHEKITWERKIRKHLISINYDEIAYLDQKEIPFTNGAEYIDHKHFYSYDLDFFGTNSLFQNLNRTATYIGGKKLAQHLVTLFKNEEIAANQEAIKELSRKIEWRQYLLAIAMIGKDTKENYQKLIDWSNTKQEAISKPLNIISYITPPLFLISILAYFLTYDVSFSYFAAAFFVINLSLAVTQLTKIKQEIINSDKIAEIVNKYGLIIEKIETENFESKKLKQLKEKLISESGLTSIQIQKLSGLFSNMAANQNGFAAILLNGVFLYHIHTLKRLLKWKSSYSEHIKEWLEVIGTFEALNSLANFSYNNPSFIYPDINQNHEIEFEELGHPLIQKEKRICNDIAFKENSFIILTGSNMSGKSTFLRTLGINMVLAGIGSPICASKATIHPLNVIVSMRQTDSLNDGESYFFAEVKRLKQIMDKLQDEVCFVLLDEILKGTNSDDKQTGTIEVLKKIISKNAIGVIATHDLEVCQTTNSYPNKLINKCFEVEIIDNDLAFDYKLKNGICKNKSATFLMKKIEII